MKKRSDRRRFLARFSLALLFLPFLNSCVSGKKEEGNELDPGSGDPRGPGDSSAPQGSAFERELAKNLEMPRDLVMKLLDQKVDQYMQRSFHCAQSSFMALKEQFGLEGEQVVKALTPMAGIAERGETCGAVTGPLMAMGLIYGRGETRLDDWDTYRNSLVPSGKFCSQFEDRYGSTMCHGVQETKFGRCYHLTDTEELRDFQAAGATDHCSEVVRSAVRMAAGIILDNAGT
jgi:C_GCAxxG_C_C family probable redox protein